MRTLALCVLEAPKSVLLLPCKHLVMCAACAKAVLTSRSSQPKCPMCRSRIADCISTPNLRRSGECRSHLHAESAMAKASAENPAENTCVVCLKAPKNTLLLPCKHLVMCAACTSSSPQCPVCKSSITDCINGVFFF